MISKLALIKPRNTPNTRNKKIGKSNAPFFRVFCVFRGFHFSSQVKNHFTTLTFTLAS
jgi:hypothetical protein